MSRTLEAAHCIASAASQEATAKLEAQIVYEDSDDSATDRLSPVVFEDCDSAGFCSAGDLSDVADTRGCGKPADENSPRQGCRGGARKFSDLGSLFDRRNTVPLPTFESIPKAKTADCAYSDTAGSEGRISERRSLGSVRRLWSPTTHTRLETEADIRPALSRLRASLEEDGCANFESMPRPKTADYAYDEVGSRGFSTEQILATTDAIRAVASPERRRRGPSPPIYRMDLDNSLRNVVGVPVLQMSSLDSPPQPSTPRNETAPGADLQEPVPADLAPRPAWSQVDVSADRRSRAASSDERIIVDRCSLDETSMDVLSAETLLDETVSNVSSPQKTLRCGLSEASAELTNAERLLDETVSNVSSPGKQFLFPSLQASLSSHESDEVRSPARRRDVRSCSESSSPQRRVHLIQRKPQSPVERYAGDAPTPPELPYIYKPIKHPSRACGMWPCSFLSQFPWM